MTRVLLTYVIYMILLFSCKGEKRHNAFTPGKLWFDNNGAHINAHGGGILFENGRYYWFGEHKTVGSGGNVANVGVHCYSSDDLYNWKDEGVVLTVDPEGSGTDIEKGSIIERPKVIKNNKTGKYVMWFHLERKKNKYSDALSGIAVSDQITGPYQYLKSVRPNAGSYPLNVKPEHKQKGSAENLKFNGWNLSADVDVLNILGRDFHKGQMARDMNLFVDDDQKAYHIYSSEENSTLHIAELSDDYLSHTGKYIRCFPGRFMEAPSMFKRKGKYYLMMSGCTGWQPNQSRSAVADSIMGKWLELGDPCVNDTAHTTFHSQSTCIFPVQGTEDAYIYMGDRWNPENAIDGRYVWLPVKFDENRFFIVWNASWEKNLFNSLGKKIKE